MEGIIVILVVGGIVVLLLGIYGIRSSISTWKYRKEWEERREEKRVDSYKWAIDFAKQIEVDKKQFVKDFDKDGSGEVDGLEDNDFDLILQKHQKTILAIDKKYIEKFVKVSAFIRDKKANIQSVFQGIETEFVFHKMVEDDYWGIDMNYPDYVNDDTIKYYDYWPGEEIDVGYEMNMFRNRKILKKLEKEEQALKDYAGILKNEINTYHTVLANGLTMIIALIDDDFLTFSKIYDSMDRINIFDSQWEKDVSHKLSNIDKGINKLIYEIEASNKRIVRELSNLTYASESGFNKLKSSINSELQSIDSSIKFNNLLTGIQTYQTYKVKKNTKNLK